jgi:acyl-CoA dehydrogenase
MDGTFNEEQEMVKNSAKEFLKTEFPTDKIRDLEESELGFDKKQWKKMAQLGWLGVLLPEKYSGMEMSFLDLVILMEQIGAHLMPGPFLATVMGGWLIEQKGSGDQKKKLLKGIGTGNIKLALALYESEDPGNMFSIGTTAKTASDGFVIDGTKLFVENALAADYLICPCKTGEASEDITLFLVAAKTPGMTISPMPSISYNKYCQVDFSQTEVKNEAVLGDINKGATDLLALEQMLVIAKCAEMVGGMQTSLSMTNSYAKQRIAYGKPIGSFQVIQHDLANSYLKTETSRNITYQTAWKISNQLPCKKEICAAKSWVGESYLFVTERGVHLHGAVGLTREDDIGLYYRHALACEQTFGNGRLHRCRLAAEMNI